MGPAAFDGGDEPPAEAVPSWQRRALIGSTGLIIVLAGVAVAANAVKDRTPPETSLVVTGVDNGVILNAAAASGVVLAINAAGPGSEALAATVDETAVALTSPLGQATLPLGALADGEHTVVITLTATQGALSRAETRTFMVDSAPPSITGPKQVQRGTPDRPAIIAGLVTDAVSGTLNGQPLDVATGSYRAQLTLADSVAEIIVADAAGNQARKSIEITDVPTISAYPVTSAVHVGQSAWADLERRDGILNLIREGRVNAVQLDIKDEVGDLGYPSAVPLATTIGAKMDFYDVAEAVKILHELNVRIIGRVVCFLDPTLAKWSWANGQPANLVLDATGLTPLPSKTYGDAAFVNFVNPIVQQYNIDLALEAVGFGFDEIIYDYVRRPEGDLGRMQFPGLTTTPEVALARFVERSAAALEPSGTMLGLSLFGVAATRPEPTAQDVRLLGPLVDYVAPMIYPALWGDGEYGVPKPWKDPYTIVQRSLVDWHAVAAGSGAAVVPWIQDFPAGRYEYNEFDVAAQIDATKASGSPGYLVWNPKSRYHGGGIPSANPPADPAIVAPTDTAAPPESVPPIQP